MRSVVRLAFGVAVLLCAASVAQAQPGGGRFGGGGGFGASRLSLLRIEAVQKELGLTEDQIAAVKKLSDELRPMGRPGGRGGNGGEGRQNGRRRGGDNPDVRVNGPERFFVQAAQPGGQRGQPTEEQIKQFREQAAERAKKEREELTKILKPDQIKRLTEIYIQQAGVQALSDADVAKELGITDDQKEKLDKARQESMTAMREAFAGGGAGGDREAARAKFTELRKSSDEKVLAVLTADQKKKFEDMKGKKFDLPEQPGRGGGGGGARPGNRETN